MTGTEKVESARAGREARTTASRKGPEPASEPVLAAMKRYLAAETYHAKRVEEEDARESSPEEPSKP